MLVALKTMIVAHGAVEAVARVAHGVVAVVCWAVEVAHQEVMIEAIVVAVATVVLEPQ